MIHKHGIIGSQSICIIRHVAFHNANRVDNPPPWNERVFCNAAQTGNRDMLLWLRENGCPWDFHTYSEAIAGGADFFTLEWLFHETCPWNKYGDYHTWRFRHSEVAS